ncbi:MULTISPECIES: Sec-independent protein translocase protein TatB [unclassified Sphingobium]|uniref:Sec-independent protein translocase protein TatB n=1 Tax=unclassified Sphingobium TaxID=2611147 RepID=UPI00076FED53|nr:MULTISPECIES: Sec-independent protein translocase protein TatB [Sphingomonadaceae]AMK24268.1 twin-arginine translocation protein TatB subunit [Sphingobium sp. TKS]NML90345.1 twin-arginine translocase subunit TatB [Sphingobium sp. TB-6]
MFGIDSSELLVIIIIAVIVIGPKDLPRALYKVGQIVGKAQGMARHFRTGIDAMVREVELEELEKKWAAQNKRIMEEHPPETTGEMEALPAPGAEAAAAGEVPPFVAESAPVTNDAPPYVAEVQPATDGPPYVAQEPARKGDTAA